MDNSEEKEKIGPPVAVHVLADVLRAWGGRWPAGMPADPVAAAQWWMQRQEPPHDREMPRKTAEGRWITPYHDRLRHTLRSFLLGSPMLQSMVVAAAAERIWWRGDDVEMFGLVIAEHDRMREMGVDAYRDRMRQAVRGLIGRVTA